MRSVSRRLVSLIKLNNINGGSSSELMKSPNKHRSRPKTMKVIFIKLIGGPKVTIAFFLACGLFLFLSLLEKPAEVIPATKKNGQKLTKHSLDPRANSVVVPELESVLNDKIWDPSDYVSNIQPPPCHSDVMLMIIVPSAPHQFERRKAIRNTWGTLKKLRRPVNHQTVFIIGYSGSSLDDPQLAAESQKHNDILFGDFVDSDGNVSLKVQYGLHWAWTQCKPEYLLKTDDDCFVNVQLVTSYLKENHRVPNSLYVGRLSQALDVVRSANSKKFVSRSAFKNELYPPYAVGKGYLLSGDVLERMVSTAPYVPLIPLEDAYIGLLAHRNGIEPIDSGRFTFYSEKWTVCNFLYLMVVHDLSPDAQYLCLRYSEECYKLCSDQVPGPIGWH